MGTLLFLPGTMSLWHKMPITKLIWSLLKGSFERQCKMVLPLKYSAVINSSKECPDSWNAFSRIAINTPLSLQNHRVAFGWFLSQVQSSFLEFLMACLTAFNGWTLRKNIWISESKSLNIMVHSNQICHKRLKGFWRGQNLKATDDATPNVCLIGERWKLQIYY